MSTPSLNQLPAPPAGSSFSLLKIENVSLPHPFVIGPKHVEIASDRFGGMLGVEAIEAAERIGYGCQWGKRSERSKPKCTLSHREHETMLTLFILLEHKAANLNDVPGLHAYLLSVKDMAEELGIQGFAFPSKVEP